MNDNLELFKNRYRQYMQVLNRSQETIKKNLYLLDKFTGFLEAQAIFDISQIRKEHISQYQKGLYYYLNEKGKQNQPQSQNNCIQAVKSFCLFLRSEGYLNYNPAKDIQYAKHHQSLPRTILTEQEIKRLMRQPDIHTSLGYRDRAILELLYSTGIRRQELFNLKPEDIDYRKGFLRVNKAKGARDRIVPLGRIASKYLENYIKLVRIDLQRRKESPYLFLSLRGERISKSALAEIILKYTKKAKLNKSISPHVFRHTCATHLLQKKANIRCVQEILGHKSLDTTQRYTQITITDLKEAHAKCHPREKDR